MADDLNLSVHWTHAIRVTASLIVNSNALMNHVDLTLVLEQMKTIQEMTERLCLLNLLHGMMHP